MVTKNQVLEIIEKFFTTKYRSPAKLNAVASSSAKFINKYVSKYFVDTVGVIDGCLQFYSSVPDLDKYLEENKVLFLETK